MTSLDMAPDFAMNQTPPPLRDLIATAKAMNRAGHSDTAIVRELSRFGLEPGPARQIAEKVSGEFRAVETMVEVRRQQRVRSAMWRVAAGFVGMLVGITLFMTGTENTGFRWTAGLAVVAAATLVSGIVELRSLRKPVTA